MKVVIKQGSLTDGDESVLVNASNTNAKLGTGVSAAIHQACGKGYQEKLFAELERQFKGPMKPGQVMITDAGTHPRAKWVAHVAVMDYREGFTGTSFPTVDVVRTACERLWDAIELLEGPQSVAMVALGAGTGNLGVAEPIRIASETLKAHAAIHRNSRIESVSFYGFQLPDYIAVAHVLAGQFPEVKKQLPQEILEFVEKGL
jgi:O-acetyl-ADP-ribose deacetylase (regulator of RNase III)